MFKQRVKEAKSNKRAIFLCSIESLLVFFDGDTEFLASTLPAKRDALPT